MKDNKINDHANKDNNIGLFSADPNLTEVMESWGM